MARSHGGGSRLGKQWNFMLGQSNALTVDATVIAAGSIGFSTSQTILRMLGEYIITPTSATTALDSALVVIGIGIVSTDAFGAGAGSMPDPAAEPDYPWMYWASHQFFYLGTAAAGNDSESIRRFFDIRSMRKVTPRQSLVVVAQYVDNAGAPPLNLNFGQTRVLVGLH